MQVESSSPTRRGFLAGSAVIGAWSLFPAQASDQLAIRSFRAHIPQQAIVDLRRRLAAIRWPDRETVSDQSQGVQPSENAGARAALDDAV